MRIEVKQLFGRYNYDIRLRGASEDMLPRISLLYGDNGSGKTTILNLVFNLLSTALSRGHKSRIAAVPFRKFVVTFSDHSTVYAVRTTDSITGAFELGLGSADRTIESVSLIVDPETGSVPSRLSPPELEPLMKRMAASFPAVFYLGDDRTLESDTLPAQHIRGARSSILRHYDDEERIFFNADSHEPRLAMLNDSIRRTQQQLYVELARASTRGEADSRQIYADILGSIASASEFPEVTPHERSALERDLQELETISKEFAAFQLGTSIDAAPLARSLSEADEQTMPIVAQVLRSFLDGQRARLKALEVLYNKMRNLISITNNYLRDKRIELDITKGLGIRIPSGELDPTLLSSGEQHLLLLLLNVFASTEHSRLFIIDEPELSLNIKWQRQLVDSLLELTDDSECQFLLATHSIELLSKHRNYVVQLRQ